MKTLTLKIRSPRDASGRLALLSLCSAAILLSACGGGAGVDAAAADPTVSASLATGITEIQLDAVLTPPDIVAPAMVPAFHVAPVVLDAPSDVDASGTSASAKTQPHTQAVPAEFSGLSTRRLAVQALRSGALTAATTDPLTATPMAAGTSVAVYSPAQIRAAYGLPALPALTAALTPAQAASLGAGQTIYVIDAYNDPNAAAELAAFNTQFGLRPCTTKAISATAALPLPAASTSACEFSVVYATAAGGMTSAAPAYNSGWASEIALDVQWAHATAPLARIVLIEATDASNGLIGAINLANAMGPGIVSMSFGGPESYGYTASVDASFSKTNMTYLAATGDNGAGVSWPAVSANVVAVGGTTLSYSGTGTRSEVAWSGTGGGISLYTQTPAYQTSAVPGLGSVAHRAVADVAFNADPASGQYVAVMSLGATAASWYSFGGTSVATPQWAGIVAIANATRLLNSKPLLGAPHSILYGQISTVPGTYASSFADVSKGTDGTCATCSAKAGYDTLTGLGTPNAASMLATLSGITALPAAPVVTTATITGKVGAALTFTASATAPDALTYTMAGAPAGMTISASGAASWATPVAGTFAVTVIAKDSVTGLTGQGVYTVVITAASAPVAPVVSSATVTGKPGAALSFAVAVTAPNPVSYTLTGAPTGMAISSAGVVAWAAPVVGTYSVTVTAKDSKTGLSGSGVYTVKIATVVAGPVLTAAPMTGVAGKPMTGSIAFSDASLTSPGQSLSISFSGLPMGVTLALSGQTVVVTWALPVTGTYSVLISAVDSLNQKTQVTMVMTVTAK